MSGAPNRSDTANWAAWPSGDLSGIRAAIERFSTRSVVETLVLARAFAAADIRLGAAGVADALHALALHDPPGRLRRFHEPRLLTWLSRAGHRIGAWEAGETGALEALARHADTLALLLSGTVDGLDGAPVVVSPHGDAGPIEAEWRLRATLPEGVRLRLAARSGGFELRDDGVVAWIPAEALAPGAPGDAVWVREGGPLVVTPVRRASTGAELLCIHTFPELDATADEVPAVERMDDRAELDRALDALERWWPEAHADVGTFCRGVAAVAAPDGHWNSSSSPDAPTVARITLRPGTDPLFPAESLVHEASHIKLDAAASLTPHFTEDTAAVWRHPWKNELRPLSSLLIAAHAFLAVAGLHARALAMGDGDATTRRWFEETRAGVGPLLDTLAGSGRLTPAGEAMVEAMRVQHAGLA